MTKLGLVLTVIGLLITFVRPAPLELVCDFNGMCFWRGDGWYRGCIDDKPILTFDWFNDYVILDLRCSVVQVVYIKFTALSCKDLNLHVITDNDVTIYLGESQTECVCNLLCYSVIKTHNNISA